MLETARPQLSALLHSFCQAVTLVPVQYCEQPYPPRIVLLTFSRHLSSNTFSLRDSSAILAERCCDSFSRCSIRSRERSEAARSSLRRASNLLAPINLVVNHCRFRNSLTYLLGRQIDAREMRSATSSPRPVTRWFGADSVPRCVDVQGLLAKCVIRIRAARNGLVECAVLVIASAQQMTQKSPARNAYEGIE